MIIIYSNLKKLFYNEFLVILKYYYIIYELRTHEVFWRLPFDWFSLRYDWKCQLFKLKKVIKYAYVMLLCKF